MAEVNVTERKGPGRATISPDEKLLVGRAEAAGMLSISCRALDYLVANKQLLIRRARHWRWRRRRCGYRNPCRRFLRTTRALGR